MAELLLTLRELEEPLLSLRELEEFVAIEELDFFVDEELDPIAASLLQDDELDFALEDDSFTLDEDSSSTTLSLLLEDSSSFALVPPSPPQATSVIASKDIETRFFHKVDKNCKKLKFRQFFIAPLRMSTREKFRIKPPIAQKDKKEKPQGRTPEH